uniref:AMP-dependent synthetase/ligase domain-containing protein n=1 Tax=Alexandrium monilatum TaxID=311494 RepID=A0A7S4T575_9DINO
MQPSKKRLNVLTQQVLAASTGADEYSVYEPGQHWGALPDYEHPIRCPAAGLLSAESTPPRLFPTLLAQVAQQSPDHPALAVERPLPPPNGPGDAPALPWAQWKKWTWADFHRDARRAAKGFMVLGVEQFGSVSIFGFNAPEWAISAYGAMFCGGKYVGIYLTDTPDQVQFKVAHSASRVIVVDSEVELENVSSKVDELPELRAIVLWGAPAKGDIRRSDGSVCRVMTFDQLLALGDAEGSEAALDGRIDAMRPGHCIGIIYTSGTTGNPKGVMINHDGAICEATIANYTMRLIDGFPPDGGRILSYLPLSHIAGGLLDLIGPVWACATLKRGATVYFARPYDLKEMTLAARIQFVRPTIFLAVPRVYEKIQARMMAVAATITGVKKSLATWAKGKGLQHARNLQVGGSKARPFLYGLADKLVLSKAREALGLDQCRLFVTGAAPIAIETLEYFGALGMQIQNCYGMSECTGVTTATSPDRNAFGTVGHGLPGLETRCFKTGPNGENIEVPRHRPDKVPTEEEQGEVCFRGRHIMMGYLANPAFGAEHVAEIEEKTRSAIDQWGWLHSGDKGAVDTNGMLRITGRYKELIIGAGGENIAPVPVEEAVKLLCPAVSNIMMVGDKRKFNVALVTLQAEGSTGEFPGGDQLAGVALEVNPQVKTVSAAMKDPTWLRYVQTGIDGANANPKVCQNNAWKIQRYAILPRDFSIQTGEFTPTLKLKRSVAEEMWKEVLDALYD